MNKQDYYIIGGTIIALGIIYYFFMYKPKTRRTPGTPGTPYFPTNNTMNYSGDITADLSTAGSNAGNLDSGDIGAGGR
jgi:hypothetical protein